MECLGKWNVKGSKVGVTRNYEAEYKWTLFYSEHPHNFLIQSRIK